MRKHDFFWVVSCGFPNWEWGVISHPAHSPSPYASASHPCKVMDPLNKPDPTEDALDDLENEQTTPDFPDSK